MSLAAAERLAGSRTESVRRHYDALASERDAWYERNRYYHDHLERAVRRIVPPGSSVLELGTGTGNLLAALAPAEGVGIDVSPAMIEIARSKSPHLEFLVADAQSFEVDRRFDFVIASDLVGELEDITEMLERVHRVSHAGTRLILTFHSPSFEPLLRGAQRLGLAMRPSRQNWVGEVVMEELLALSDFYIEQRVADLMLPVRLPLLSGLVNDHLGRSRPLRYFNLLNLMVARPIDPRPRPSPLSCSVVIPCRNEVGNVAEAVSRTPDMGAHTEIVFVDGASTDGTRQRIEELIAENPKRDIKLLLQVPDADYTAPVDDALQPTRMLKLGKGDAVRKGFAVASGDVLMILDADLTVPPEDLPRFFNAIATGKGRLINGTRLVYPMERRAMRFVNYIGNWFFSVLFTWLLEQPIRDTLCGTKVLRREDYDAIREGRGHFGDFDPFGDFDLLFGAARLKLPIVEVPVRYRRRVAGVSKVRVSQHGWLLAGMALVGLRRLKLAKWSRRVRRGR